MGHGSFLGGSPLPKPEWSRAVTRPRSCTDSNERVYIIVSGPAFLHQLQGEVSGTSIPDTLPWVINHCLLRRAFD